MPEKEYRKAIKNLHEKLESIKSRDDVPTEKIEEIQGTIQKLIKSSDKEYEELHGSVISVLEDAVGHFQISHPDLTALIRTVINDLNMLGI
jgi:hypothetical protein